MGVGGVRGVPAPRGIRVGKPSHGSGRLRPLSPVRYLEAFPDPPAGCAREGRPWRDDRRRGRRVLCLRRVRRLHEHDCRRTLQGMKRWPYPRLFAHRGGGSLAPENTLAAVKLGQSLGYRAHEFDVKLTKDNVAMLLHDATLERTTTGKGRAADFTWKELAVLDAGAWHSP